MTISVKNILTTSSKDLIYNELRKAGVEFEISRTEERDTLEVIFPSGDKKNHYSLGSAIPDQKEEKIKLLVQNVKTEIRYLINFSTEPLAINLSVHLSEKFHYDYTYLASLFSRMENLTIERFVIVHKIERVKELMIDKGLSVSEIAILMHYSSISHLASQFKKVTGLTTSQFKRMNDIAHTHASHP